jgi:hypothetical protein
MATVDGLYQALFTQINTAFAGTNPLLNNLPVLPAPEIGIDWPAQKCIGAVSNGTEPALISFFDRGTTKNITRAIPMLNVLPPIGPNPGATLTPSSLLLKTGETVTLTGSGTPVINDAFCLTLIYGSVGQNQLYAEITASGTTTLSDALTSFTGQINLIENFSASLSGDVITVTSAFQQNVTVRAEVTNIATVTQEGYRWLRDIQITLWVPSPAARSKYGDVLEQLFAQLEVNYGFFTSDNTAVRLTVTHDHLWTDSQLQDYYRRDFIIQLDYAVLNTLPAFPIETIKQTYGILS